MILRYHVQIFRSLAIACVLACFAAGPAAAQDEVTLTPSKDNTMYEESGSTSNGAGEFLFVGRTGPNAGMVSRRALLHFDVADALPDNVTVDRVELSLSVSQAPVQGSATTDVGIHRLTADWGEAGSNAGVPGGTGADAESGDATWTHAFFDSEMWDSEGGDFEATASANISLGTDGRATVESTGSLADDVQAWLDDPSTNFGWILIGDEANDHTARRLDSREGVEADRPQLTIHYTEGTAAERPDVPGDFVLEGAYPNPFSRTTAIRYVLEQSAPVTIRVFDLMGRPVASVERRMQSSGPHQAEVDASEMASGLYIYCVEAGASRECRTVTVLK